MWLSAVRRAGPPARGSTGASVVHSPRLPCAAVRGKTATRSRSTGTPRRAAGAEDILRAGRSTDRNQTVTTTVQRPHKGSAHIMYKEVPLRDRCNFGRSSWLIRHYQTYVPSTVCIWRGVAAKIRSRQRHGEKGAEQSATVRPSGRTSSNVAGRSSTGFHGSSPCKCQRLSTLRSS